VSKSENLPGGLSRRPRRSAPVRVKIKNIQGNVVSFSSAGPTDRVWRKQLKEVLGTVSDAFVDMALQQLERAARLSDQGPSNVSINGALAIIAAFAPRNEAEAALALQAACAHMVAMVLMARIGDGYGGSRRLPALASGAAKLMRVYCLQVETMRRLRNGGTQVIRVERLEVSDNAQAIIGNINPKPHDALRSGSNG
jgi:hypothetical protein